MPYGLKKKTGQIAAVLLLVMAVMFFLGSVGIFYAQKKYFQTKAKIAADAGAMYLGSIVGSYAHYLACKYLKCKCKKKKRRWGAIVGLGLSILGGFLGGFGIVGLNWALAISTTGLATFVADEVVTNAAVKRLRAAFKRLSNVRDVLRWSTISYVAQLLADPEVIPQLSEALEAAINGSAGSNNNGGLDGVLGSMRKEIIKAYYYYSGLPGYAGSPGKGGWIEDLLEALSLWDKLAGTNMDQPAYYTEAIEPDEDEVNPVLSLSSFDYLRAVLYGGAGTNPEMSLAGLMWALAKKEVDPVQALQVIKDWDPEEQDEDGQFSRDFERMKRFVNIAVDTIRNSDLKGTYSIQRVRSFGPGSGWKEIRRYGRVKVVSNSTVSPLMVGSHAEKFVHGSNYLEMLRDIYERTSKGEDVYMTEWQYTKLKERLIASLMAFSSSMDRFMDRINQIENKYRDLLMKAFGEGSYAVGGNDFRYSWRDKLGRRHSLEVRVSFKMPKIKVKKKLTKVKIKVKRCKQVVWVRACRNGYCFTTRARYYAKKHRGPTTNNWWIQGN